MPLDEVIHQPQRLRIMATLFALRQAAWTDLKRHLGLTDGNLAGHLARLVAAGYLGEGRVFTGARFEQRYAITDAGSRASSPTRGSWKPSWLRPGSPREAPFREPGSLSKGTPLLA